MLRRIVRRLIRRTELKSSSIIRILVGKGADELSQRALVARLASIPYWEDKIQVYKEHCYLAGSGMWRRHEVSAHTPQPQLEFAGKKGLKVHYGCGGTLKEGWLNIDLHENPSPLYRSVNLLEQHPFDDDAVEYGYCEDMLEHLEQGQSIFFLAEVFRTLTRGGVFRVSFPGLEGVLKRHYTPPTEMRIREGEFEAYAFWDHIHFYSKAELELVARHLGFSDVKFREYGESDHQIFVGIDTRHTQADLNTFAELTK